MNLITKDACIQRSTSYTLSEDEAVRLLYQKHTKILGTKKISEYRQLRERKAAAGKELHYGG
jgi:hypothetical protein